MTQEDLAQIQGMVNGAHRVLVLTHKNPSVDTMASVLALYLALSKMGKDVTAAMETAPLVEVSNLVGIDQVRTSLAGNSLLITYRPYTLGDFEKVSYLEDPSASGDSFKLTITPRQGFAPDPKSFSFSTSGATADLIFTVEVLEPPQLGALYDPNLFANPAIINIDNHDPNKDYGKFNLVEPDAASVSEITTFFLRAIGAPMDADIAGNLYQGVVWATNNFQSEKVAAATLEAAAICLRAGAKAKPVAVPPAGAAIPVAPQVAPRTAPQAQPAPIQPGPVPAQPVSPTPQPGQDQSNVPSDWTQPKAYRGTSVI